MLERYQCHMKLLEAWNKMEDKEEDRIKRFRESEIGQENSKVFIYSFYLRRMCNIQLGGVIVSCLFVA